MSTVETLAQIKSLRVQLDVLEAQVRKSAPSSPGPGHTVADLYGLLKEEGDISLAEIDAAHFKVPAFPDL